MKKAILGQAIAGAAVLCLAGFSHSASAAEGDGWQWTVAPYVWFAGVNTDLTSEVPPSDASSDRQYRDILDDFNGGFEIHAEGQGQDFGMFADFTYLSLKDDQQRTNVRTDSTLDTTLFELAGTWNPSGQGANGFQILGGLRYISADLDFKLTPNDPAFPTVRIHPDKAKSDFMLGGRYTFDMAERWALTLRADGSWGQTDGTWNVSALAQYKMEHGAWLFGYRYLSVALKNDNITTDIAISGPTVGYGFKF